MNNIMNIVMLSISTVIMFVTFKRVAQYKSNTLADFAILLIYIFQCIPVMLDLLMGIPKYDFWYQGFQEALTNQGVAVVYDLYIIILLCSLYFLSIRQNKKYQTLIRVEDKGVIFYKVPAHILWGFILLPIIHVFFSGNLSAFTFYASYGDRGLDSTFTTINSNLSIISIIAFCAWFYRKSCNYIRIIIFIAYSFSIIWISGKRYMVITVIYAALYMYLLQKKNSRKKINLYFLVGAIVIGVIVYSIYYITSIKTISDGDFESTYAMLRIDFGRDDVVKYTIMKEYFQNEHILEYPLETVISTIFMIIPRTIFPLKPYPHYRYLTASLYNTTILDIPSGMTPSILEMMISNFRWLGIPICILFLCWYCKKADQDGNRTHKLVYSIVLMVMLSQSVDSAIIPFYLVIYYLITSKVKFTISLRK